MDTSRPSTHPFRGTLSWTNRATTSKPSSSPILPDRPNRVLLCELPPYRHSSMPALSHRQRSQERGCAPSQSLQTSRLEKSLRRRWSLPLPRGSGCSAFSGQAIPTLSGRRIESPGRPAPTRTARPLAFRVQSLATAAFFRPEAPSPVSPHSPGDAFARSQHPMPTVLILPPHPRPSSQKKTRPSRRVPISLRGSGDPRWRHARGEHGSRPGRDQ